MDVVSAILSAIQQWFSHSTSPTEFLLTGMMGLLIYLVRNIVITQHEITKSISNHLEHISAHMAATNKVLEIMAARVLDSALRKPESNPESNKE